ncbi:MAG: hypothetical protein UY08_C0003G0019 [Candidatus Gottesmanbacteria bacterium GW2011_GWA1_47_8]|uniref:Glycosidase-related protein n=1 Tax=Candidatus Gottesmanbacteria bacterium GW2011_GWA1_47_8 TaxID=1618438 RepID=A0A0G1VSC7_9BACT|nr:MAG: hypothetical protein UY08_C0003G0019 [Candidatus Gottesmanbacteria bacterium GW2011_GWA1_47_8]
MSVIRSDHNPLISPDSKKLWVGLAAFNPSVSKKDGVYHMLFRAMSTRQKVNSREMNLSTIGYASSHDGITYGNQRLFVGPDYEWEEFGCEDPRVTFIEDEFIIFYTGLANFPPTPADIKIGVVTTKDFSVINRKRLVTPFNSKAMGLFPTRIADRLTAILTVHTDLPPSKIAIASFYSKEDIWNPEYWRGWYRNLEEHTVPLQRMKHDQVEVGAPPLELPEGWLLIYSYIQDYTVEEKRQFRIEAVMLDKNNPQVVIGRLEEPLIIPQTEYELKGQVNNVVFPSGALVDEGQLKIYYGAADTYCCLASLPLAEVKAKIRKHKQGIPKLRRLGAEILKPDGSHYWEAKAVFNPAAVFEQNKIHLIYRAMSPDNTSVFGYANSQDGYHIDERLDDPVYLPKIEAEMKRQPNANSGVEDPRLSRLGDHYYMTYTAYDGVNPPRIALTKIRVDDFLRHRWNWQTPVLISSPKMDNKNACLLPEKINGHYVMFHRLENSIHLDYLDSLDFDGSTFLTGQYEIPVRPESWDALKIGISTPPVKTEKGWILLYHGISRLHHEYRVGAMLLDLTDPTKVLARTPYALLEPEAEYEIHGQVANVVFPCGAVAVKGELFVYYGAADQVVAVASVNLNNLLAYLDELYHPTYFA